jgi:hypothetical protein
VHTQRHRTGAGGEQRNVARELQRVAKTLLGLHINVLAGEAFALQGPLWKTRALALARAQPPLIFLPALGQIATHEQEDAEPGVGVGVMRQERDRAAQCHASLIETAGVVQRGAEVGPGVGVVGLQFDGAGVGSDRAVELAQSMQRVAEIAVRLGEGRIGGDCLALRPRRFLVVLQLIERDAEVAQRRRHRWLDFERAPRLLGRELGPAGEPVHLAEIGVEQRHLRRKLDRALHVDDRLAQSSVLVRDHPEQVFCLRHIRLQLEDLAADRLCLDQPALAAAAFGVHQRFADRHERCLPLPSRLFHAFGIVIPGASHGTRRGSLQQAKTSWPPRFILFVPDEDEIRFSIIVQARSGQSRASCTAARGGWRTRIATTTRCSCAFPHRCSY